MNPNQSYYDQQQLNLVFDEYPNHGGATRPQSGGYTPPFISWVTSKDGLIGAGFHELESDPDMYENRGTWKRGPDEMGRVIYLTFDGKACFVKHVYDDHKLANSSFQLDNAYASALYMGRDNAFMFYNFGPTERTEADVLADLFATVEDK